VAKLAKDINGIVAFSRESASFLVPKNKLTDTEALLIWLAAYYIGEKLGLVKTSCLTKEELQIKLRKSGKITSTRLGELTKTEMVVKTDGDKFKITTFGVFHTQKEILPNIKFKTSIRQQQIVSPLDAKRI
jgi:hypothetical protein